MQATSNIINKYNNTDFMSATGPVEIGLTNDYLFRIVFLERCLSPISDPASLKLAQFLRFYVLFALTQKCDTIYL